jgi:uncharacterized repeat protein (TIGR01451 family)
MDSAKKAFGGSLAWLRRTGALVAGSRPAVPAPGRRAARRTSRATTRRRRAATMRRRLAATLAVAVPLSMLTVAALPAVQASAAQVACTPTAGFTNCARFTYSGGDQTFTVPSGVTSLDVRMWGAGGGGIDPGYFLNQYSGGGGGYTTGTAAVTPGEVLTVTAGRGGVIKGVAPTYGGGGAGGTGGEPGDSGGGMSALWDGAFGTDPLLIAGGGGGATNGAPTTTNTHTDPVNVAGGAGGGTTGGTDGTRNSGTGGTQAGGGLGSTVIDALACASHPTNGGQYQGGNGGASPHFEGGGGGGGGYYGGGGGRCQVDNTHLQNGAGGGGSGFTGGTGVTGAATAQGSNPIAVGLNQGVPPAGTSDPLYTNGIGYGGGLNGRSNGGNGEVVLQWVTQVSLSVTKTASPNPFLPGQPITYTVTVANGGPSAAINAAVADNVPAALTGVTWTCAPSNPAPTQCNTTSGTGSINTTANIASGGQVVYTITGNVPAGATSANNTATVTPPPNTSDPACTPNCSANSAPTAGSPSMTVVKSASPTSFSGPNQTITFSFLVTNTGNVAVSAVTVTDPLPGVSPVSCPQPTLAAGASETCTASYTTTQADYTAGSVQNSATAQGTPAGSSTPIQSPASDVTVPVTPAPALEVVKSALPTTFDGPGTTITYSYLVTNTGNVAVGNIKVNDGLAGLSSLSCPTPQLAAGASETCTATYQTTQADVDAGNVVNTANVQGTPAGSTTPIDSPPSDVTVTATQDPALTMVKSALPTTFSAAGTVITYSYVVTNSGNVTMTSIKVDDVLPGLSGVLCLDSTLDVGKSETCTATYLTTPADVDAGKIVNSATAQGDPPGSATPVDSPSSGVTVSADQSPKLEVVKSASPATFDAPGQTITYRYLVTNSGNVTMSGISISDALPGLSPVSCPQPALDAGDSEICTATYVTTQADLNAGKIVNSATAAGTPPGSSTPVHSPPSQVTVDAIRSATLELVKSAAPATFSGPGTTIHYSFLVTNTGNVTLSGITVNDTLAGLSPISCPSPGLGAGKSETCTATYVTTQADVDAGGVLNSATAHGTPPGSHTPEVSPPSGVSVPATQLPAMTVAKSAAPTTFSGPGQTITFSFLVTNTGNVKMSGVKVNDALPGLSAIDCPQTTLDAGASETCTATYVTTQADVDAGKVVNSANVQGDPPGSDTPVESPPGSTTVAGTQEPAMTVVKSAAPTTFSGPGQTITFSFLVTNSGNVTMSGVSVNDALPGLSAVSCPQAALDAGKGETCTATYVTTQADLDQGSVFNTASAQGDPPGSGTPISSPPSDSTVTATQTASLTLAKSALPTTFGGPGQTITYRYLVTNTGNVTMSAIKINDALPGLSAISCPQAALDAGQSETCTATYVTTQADVDAGKIVNSATAQGDPPGSTTPVDSPPSQTTVSATGTFSGGLTVAKSASPSTFSGPGQTITFRFLVTNTGIQTVSAISVNDQLPGISTVSCPDPVLGPGRSETCTATYVTTQADVDAGSVHNSATAQGTPPGSTTPEISPPSEVTVPATQTPGFTLSKSASPSTFSGPGQTITFSFLVTNSGNVTMDSIKIDDSLPGLSAVMCPQAVLDVGQSETCTGTYVTTQADVDAGKIVNSASVQGNPPGSDTPVESSPSGTTVTASQASELTLAKSASPMTFSGPGQTITYSFLVTNTGNVTMSDITISDGLPGLSAIDCPELDLAAGKSQTCTATYVTTQEDIDAGSVVNAATALGDPPGSQTAVSSPPSQVTVTGRPRPALTVVKSASPTTYTGPGQTIGFRFLVTNSGNVTMRNIKIDDALPGLSPVSCPQSTLTVGQSETCTGTYVTTQADVNAGKVVNSATAQGTPPGSGTPVDSPASEFTITASQHSTLELVKSATPPTFNAPGETISYHFRVTNTGNVTLSNVRINDSLPGASTVSCPLTSLDPGESETCSATYLTTQADVDHGSVHNSATAQGDPPGSETPKLSPPSSVTVPAEQDPMLKLAKTALPTTFTTPGQTITYSYLVTNTGNVTMSGIAINDALPGLSPVQCPQSGLGVGKSETCTATYVTTQADINAGKIVNSATAQGDPPGSDTPVDSPPSQATVTANSVGTLSVVKSATPASFTGPGQTIHYSFLVTNTGNLTLSSISINDALPGLSEISCPEPALGPDATETCTATYVTTQADVDAGSVYNSATAQGDLPGSDTPVVSPPSDNTVSGAVTPGLTLVKSALPNTFSAPGQTITYSFLVTNSGNVTMSGIKVNDAMPGLSAVTCPQSGLGVGQSETCTATYVTTQADVNAGQIVNSATAQGDPPGSDTPVDSPPASITVPGTQTPALKVVKTALPSVFNAAGQTITYSFLVTNTGNVLMSGIQVNDTMTGLSAINCPASALAAGASETCTASYVTTQSDVDAGRILNSATAQGTPPGSSTPVVSPPSAVTVDGARQPGINVVKSANPTSFSKAGTLIYYSYLVTNTGNVSLTAVQINDPMQELSEILCPATILAPGASETCTATYVTTQADVDAGSITDYATAQGNPQGSPVPIESQPSRTTVSVVQGPALTVVKTASRTTFSRPGTLIQYAFKVSNTGNVTLNNVQVIDTSLPGLSSINCPVTSLLVGGQETCTATYTTTKADVKAGKVTNTATAEGTPAGSSSAVGSPPSSATVVFIAPPAPKPHLYPHRVPVTG